METMTEIDTGNWQMVAAQGPNVLVMMPMQKMTPAEALTHAAWLVEMASAIDPDLAFEDYQKAIRS